MRPFWVKPHSCLFYDSMVCFLLPKCPFFTNAVYKSGLSSQHCVSIIFVITVLVKKCTPCQGVVWFSPSKCHIFYTCFFDSSTLLTQLKPPEALEQAAKEVEGAALELPPGLTHPGPCKPKFWKNDLQPTCFCCAYFPKSVTNLHRLFNMSSINTHFAMFFKN